MLFWKKALTSRLLIKVLTSRLWINSLKLNNLELIGLTTEEKTVESSNLISLGTHLFSLIDLKKCGTI